MALTLVWSRASGLTIPTAEATSQQASERRTKAIPETRARFLEELRRQYLEGTLRVNEEELARRMLLRILSA